MAGEYNEYVTFTVTTKSGDTVEMAKLTSLMMDLSEPYEEYNINGVKKQKATTAKKNGDNWNLNLVF